LYELLLFKDDAFNSFVVKSQKPLNKPFSYKPYSKEDKKER